LTTSSYFDNLEFDIFDAGSLQCHFKTSVPLQLDWNEFSILA